MPIPSKKPQFSANAVSIVKTLVANGYDAYIVGGAVRDHLLGHLPKDYDIATNATPEQVRDVFTRRRARIIGRRFRLCHVLSGGVIFEVSTFRREPDREERKRRQSDNGTMIWSDNEYGTLDDDVRRRDFTVNALYCDVARTGRIIDKCGGTRDAKQRIVRVLGDPDTRFREDPVRMLRALKLVGQHGFTMEEKTQLALLRNEADITLASQARMLEEIFKILFTGKSLKVFEACHQYGFLKYLLPILDECWDDSVGIETRALLAERDNAIHEDPEYPESRSLALATLVFPYLRAELGSDFTDPQRSSEIADFTAKLVRRFFDHYKIPHQNTLDVRDIALMLSRLAFGKRLSLVARNHLYPNAYELFRLLTISEEWHADAFIRLPLPQAPAVKESASCSDNIHIPRKRPQ